MDSNLIHMTKSTSEEDEGHNRIILYVSRKKMEEMESKFPKLHLVRFFHENYGVYHLAKEQREDFMDLYFHLKREFNQKQKNYQQPFHNILDFQVGNAASHKEYVSNRRSDCSDREVHNHHNTELYGVHAETRSDRHEDRSEDQQCRSHIHERTHDQQDQVNNQKQ